MAMAVVLLLIVLKSKHRITLLAGAVIAGVLALPFVPQKWLERQQTVASYGEDSSAMSRVDNWKFCWRVAQEYPLTGAGFDWQSREMFERYAPEFIMKYNGKIWNTHNIFFSILTSHGFPGLFCFVGMILFCLVSCTQLKWSVRRVPELMWVRTYSDMIQLSLIAFAINGMFVNMEYFDLPYHWVSVITSLKVIVSRELSEHQAESPYIDESNTVRFAAT
jgi:probable O-glycosylation ligase (exosortase A-associated)